MMNVGEAPSQCEAGTLLNLRRARMFEVMIGVWFGLLALGYSALFMAERAEVETFLQRIEESTHD
jgi:hypothetical protein